MATLPVNLAEIISVFATLNVSRPGRENFGVALDKDEDMSNMPRRKKKQST